MDRDVLKDSEAQPGVLAFGESRMALLEILFLHTPMGIAIFDQDLVLQRCNPTWAEFIARYTPTPIDQVTPGAYLFDLVPGGDEQIRPVLDTVFAGETVRVNALRSEAEGIVSYWDVLFAPIVEGDRVIGMVDVTIDATERVKSRQALEEAYEMLETRVQERTQEIERRRQAAEGLQNILNILNSDRPFEEIVDYVVHQSSQLLGSDACLMYRLEQDHQWMVVEAEYNLPADHKALKTGPVYPTTIVQAALERRPAAVRDLPTYVTKMIDKPTLTPFHRRWFEASARHFRSALGVPLIVKNELYGGMVFYYSRATDFSEADFALAGSLGNQAALAIENARLHRQTEQLAVVRERERLARELHDSVTQSLYSVTLLAEAGQRLAADGDLTRVQGYLDRLGEISQQALKEMRLLVYELRPLVLRREGLVGALQLRLDAVEKRAGVDARLLTTGEIELPAPMEEALYRIAQEALNNALKHAAPTAVTVHVQRDACCVTLEVTDDGQGFDPTAPTDAGGMGLISMRERVEKLGGELEITSSPGQGTTVRVRLEVT
ncbi:MAG: GAF domain-containing protein [Anaerolineae bacterium]|jgi:signal transduction histidine kinase